MIKIIKVIAVLLVFTAVGVEVNAQTDPQIKQATIPDRQMTKKFYTKEFHTQGGYNKPLPGMTHKSGSLYYGNDGFIYNMADGSRQPGNPPKPQPEHSSL